MKSVLIAGLLVTLGLLSACRQDPPIPTPIDCTDEPTDEFVGVVSPESVTVRVGQTVLVTYTWIRCLPGPPTGPTEPAEPTEPLTELTFTSSNPAVASVNSGFITGVAVGKTDIVVDDTTHGIIKHVPVTVVAED